MVSGIDIHTLHLQYRLNNRQVTFRDGKVQNPPATLVACVHVDTAWLLQNSLAPLADRLGRLRNGVALPFFLESVEQCNQMLLLVGKAINCCVPAGAVCMVHGDGEIGD